MATASHREEIWVPGMPEPISHFVHVVRAGSQFEVLASNDMGEMLVASPAFSGGRLYLRGAKHLFCIEER